MATKDMPVYCFDALISHFDGLQLATPSFPNHEYPLFVTWKKVHSPGDEPHLRGCIGTFSAQPLHHGLKEYSLTSALRDKRFDPMKRHEVSSLHCGVSLLTNFEPAAHCYDWSVGTHGINIDFTDPQGKRRHATYLPEVAHEQGWNHQEALDSLIAKAGWKGSVNEALRRSVAVERYQSSKVAMDFPEYTAYKAKK